MKMIHKLGLVMLAITLLIPVVGFYALHLSENALEDSIGRVSMDLAENIVSILDHHIQAKIHECQVYSRARWMQEALARSNSEFEQMDDFWLHLLEADEAWTSLPEDQTNPLMRQLTQGPVAQGFRDIMAFHQQKYGRPVIGEMFLTNRYGANVAQSGRTTDYRQDDEPWWQAARDRGTFVGELGYDRSAGIYSTDIAVRVEDERGRFAGVLKVVFNIEEFIKVIDEAQASGIAEEQRPDGFRLLTSGGEVLYSTRDFELYEDASTWLPAEVMTSSGLARAGTFTGHDEGFGDTLFAWARSTGYRDFTGMGWILVLEHRHAKIHAPIAALRSRILWASIFCAALGIGLGSVLVLRISRRIVHLREGAEIIGSGDLDHRIGSTARDEVGQVSRAFDRMAVNLKEITASRDELNREIARREAIEDRLRQSRDESEHLLLNVLPGPIAERLKRHEGIIADRFDDVSILFANIVGFTRLTAHSPPIEVVGLLNEIFSEFDRLAERYRLEKMKTVGDRYMVAAGLPEPMEDHAAAAARMAIGMKEAMRRFNESRSRAFNVRIGIHSGPVAAGIIGVKKFVYDLWGDTVNLASFMEMYGVPDRIQVSAETRERLEDGFLLEERGTIEIPGRGKLDTWFLVGMKAREERTLES